MSYFCTVASDSPSLPRSFDRRFAQRLQHLLLGLPPSLALLPAMSPVWQFTAFNPITYWLPRLAIDPASMALLPVRWQISRATSGVSFASGGRAISFNVSTTLLSESTLRKGDCSGCNASALLQRVVEYAFRRFCCRNRPERCCPYRSGDCFDANDSRARPQLSSDDRSDRNRNLPELANPSRRSHCRRPQFPSLPRKGARFPNPASAVASQFACRPHAGSAGCGLSPAPC